MAGKKGMKQYSRELKERAVHMALDEGMGYAAITEALAIRDPWRVRRWVHADRKEGAHAFDRPKGQPASPPPRRTSSSACAWRRIS